MSELIDREALKDAVKRYAGEPIKKKDRKCQAICLDMLGIIDAQPTDSPWHRVEDGFPCENTDALFYDENGYFHVGFMSRFRGYTEFIDYDGNTLRGVTHWMPIEPPQEDE